MKKRMYLLLLILYAMLFTGCQCKHDWKDASCTAPKTCSKCGNTEGTASEHTLGILNREYDYINCEIQEEIGCTVCSVHLQTETHQLDSLIKDGSFLFTPQEFCDRFLAIGLEYYDDFSYEFSSYSGVLQAIYHFDGDCEAIVSFFYPNTTFLEAGAVNAKEIWCVSIGGINESQSCNEAFFRACDPALDADSAYSTSLLSLAAMGNAIEGKHQFAELYQNGLFYQILVPTGNGLYSYSIHASKPIN